MPGSGRGHGKPVILWQGVRGLLYRTFSKLRQMLANNEMLRQRIEDLERKYQKHDQQFQTVFDALKEILAPPPSPSKKQIGFHVKYD